MPSQASTIPTGYTIYMNSKGVSHTGSFLPLAFVRVTDVSARVGIRIWNGRIYVFNDNGGAFCALICHVFFGFL